MSIYMYMYIYMYKYIYMYMHIYVEMNFVERDDPVLPAGNKNL